MLKVGGQPKPAVSFRLAAYVVIAGMVLVALVWRLGSLTNGLSPTEVAARTGSGSFDNLSTNPIDAPHQLLQHFLFMIGHNPLSLRLASAIAAALFGFCFYKLATKWFGRLIGLFGTLIFLFLPLLLVSARQATAEIMLFSPIALIWLYAWLTQPADRRWPAWLSLLLAAGLLVYTPGIIWWLIVGGIVCRQKLMEVVEDFPGWVGGLSLAGLALMIAPLIASSIYHPYVAKQLFLIPSHWLSIVQSLKNIGWMALALVYKTPYHSPLIIDRLALMNLIVIVLVVFGVFAMQIAARAKLAWLSVGVIFAIIAAGLNYRIAILALGLPALGLLAAAGLRYLYIEWRSIFPLNPVPKTFAILLIALVTAAQVYFGFRYAIVAWPHSPAIHSLYVLK